MDRRGFLKLFGAGVAGIALEQAIPLGRVWSFPKDLKIRGHIRGCEWFDEKLTIDYWHRPFKVGTTIRIRMPQRFIVRDYFREHDQLTEILNVGDQFAVVNVLTEEE